MRRYGIFGAGTLLSGLSLLALTSCGMDSDPTLLGPSRQGQAEEASSRELNIRVYPKVTSENVTAFTFGEVEQVRKYQDSFTVTFTSGQVKSIQTPDALFDMDEEEIKIFLNNVHAVLISIEDLTPFVEDEDDGLVVTQEFMNLNSDRFFENLTIIDELVYDERLLGVAMDLLVLEYFDVRALMNMMQEAIDLFQTAVVQFETCYRDRSTREEMYICEYEYNSNSNKRTQKVTPDGHVTEEVIVDTETGEIIYSSKDDDDDRSLAQKIWDWLTGNNKDEEDEGDDTGSGITWESEGRFPMVAHYMMGSYALNILYDPMVHLALTNTMVAGQDLQHAVDLADAKSAELYQSDLLSFQLQDVVIRHQ